jgi:hypothetical protein
MQRPGRVLASWSVLCVKVAISGLSVTMAGFAGRLALHLHEYSPTAHEPFTIRRQNAAGQGVVQRKP